MERIRYNQEQLQQLVTQVQQEDSPQAWCALKKWYKPLQQRLLRKVPSVVRDQYESETDIAFIKAVRSYDPGEGASVKTWVLKQARFSIQSWKRDQRRKNSPLNSKENRCIPALKEAISQLQQEQQTEHPGEQSVIDRYREIKGATPSDEHLLHALRWLRRGGVSGQFTGLDEEGPQVDPNPEPTEPRADRARWHRFVRRVLGEKMAVKFLVQQALERLLGKGDGPDWKAVQHLVQQEVFQVAGFFSWRAVHAQFGMPAWVSTDWNRARETQLKGGNPLTDRAYRSRRATALRLLLEYSQRYGL